MTEHAGDNDARSVTVLTLHDALTGGSRQLLNILLASVGLVLLIACVNVASTLLARGEERRKELAIRSALGASRARIVRQLLMENLLLAIGGAIGGLLFAGWLVRVLLALNPAVLPRPDSIGIDLPVLMFTLLLALVTPLALRTRALAAGVEDRAPRCDRRGRQRFSLPVSRPHPQRPDHGRSRHRTAPARRFGAAGEELLERDQRGDRFQGTGSHHGRNGAAREQVSGRNAHVSVLRTGASRCARPAGRRVGRCDQRVPADWLGRRRQLLFRGRPRSTRDHAGRRVSSRHR